MSTASSGIPTEEWLNDPNEETEIDSDAERRGLARAAERRKEEERKTMMEDFASETDSDYTSYWRDWVGFTLFLCFHACIFPYFSRPSNSQYSRV